MTSTRTSTRVIFIDVDGTILEHGSVIAPSTVTAIRTAREKGHLVYLCTGRSDGDILADVRDIGFDGAISNGGAFGVSGDEVVISHTMPRPDVERLVAYFEQHGIHFFLQAHDAMFASPGVFDLMNGFIRDRDERRREDLQELGLTGDEDDLLDSVLADAHQRYRDVADADLDTIAKAVFISDRSDSVERAQSDLGDRFHVIPGSMPLPGGSNGEISLLGINKGAAIVEMLAHLGLDPQDAVGIGDSWNDAEMFDVCGDAVAMAGADPELKARAGRVTTGVLDDGVWNAFVELGII